MSHPLTSKWWATLDEHGNIASISDSSNPSVMGENDVPLLQSEYKTLSAVHGDLDALECTVVNIRDAIEYHMHNK